jgi:hypothetical protein
MASKMQVHKIYLSLNHTTSEKYCSMWKYLTSKTTTEVFTQTVHIYTNMSTDKIYKTYAKSFRQDDTMDMFRQRLDIDFTIAPTASDQWSLGWTEGNSKNSAPAGFYHVLSNMKHAMWLTEGKKRFTSCKNGTKRTRTSSIPEGPQVG